MKITLRLTVKQCAFIMRKLFPGYCHDKRFENMARFTDSLYKGIQTLGESIETQVLDQIVGTKHMDEYKKIRCAKTETVWTNDLPWYGNGPKFPYTHNKRYEEMVGEK